MDARRIAYTALLRVMRDKSYSNLALDAILKAENPSAQERQLASTLFYGVLERKLTIDYTLSRYIKKKLASLDDEVLVSLELGVYQLACLAGIPQPAAVNESVNLIKKSKKRSAAGFVNGVLRAFQRDGCRFRFPEEPGLFRLSVETGMPEEILRRWSADYSEETAAALARACLGRPPLHLRVNPLRGTAEEAAALLEEEGAEVKIDPDLPNCLEIFRSGSIAERKAFREGLVSVQDKASQLCALAVGAQPGERVFDLCAAPGSKSFVMAQEMEDRGELRAFDLYPARAGLIRQGAERLGITCIREGVGDASQFDESLGLADRVLCDAPCSGLGIIRRKPEIRWKTAEELDALPPLQLSILENAARYVRPGGTLVYSTCALSKAENEGVAGAFLAKHPEFQPDPMPPAAAAVLGEGCSSATLTPLQGNFDGFYIARFVRR